MGYPFVPARYDYGIRNGPALALVLHMAEGGGTVKYLAGKPARGVSVHFVAEKTGRIVQMLPLDHASGSINPATLRTSDDAVGPYGASVARSVLGKWYVDPNAATITMEIEGFAKDGPNPLQNKAIHSWAGDMQLVLGSLTGALGHRDFQDYKPCPGQHVDWTIVNGHGLWHGSGPIGGDVDATFTPAEGLVAVKGGKTRVYDSPDVGGTVLATYPKDATAVVIGGKVGWRVAITTLGGAERAAWLRADEISDLPAPDPAPAPTYTLVTEQLYRKT